MIKKTLMGLMLLTVASCDGFARGCSSEMAENFGADWIVAQRKYDGSVLHCWRLKDVSITNEPGSDGIYWQGADGNLIHISGWYDRVQISGEKWVAGAASIGVALTECQQ